MNAEPPKGRRHGVQNSAFDPAARIGWALRLDALLVPLVAETAPELLAVMGLGTDTTSALLLAAGDNPERLRSEGDLRPPVQRLSARYQQRQERAAPTQPRR
jgi:hypothetical protein